MQGWDQRAATPLRFQLESYRSGSGARSRTVYRLSCRYAYTIDGVRYENETLYPLDWQPSAQEYGPWEDNNTLTAAKEAGRTVPVFVDPADSNRSVLFPRVHNAGRFLAIFGTVWLSMTVIASVVIFLRWRDQSTFARGPEPWLHVDAWRDGRVLRRQRIPMRVSLVITAALGLALGWSISLLVSTSDWYVNPVLVVVLAAMFFFVSFCVSAMYVVPTRRFGSPVLQLDRVPFCVGEVLEAKLLFDRALDVGTVLKCALVCRSQAYGGFLKTKHRSIEELTVSSGDIGGSSTTLSLAMPIPREAPGRRAFEDGATRWRLRVSAKGSSLGPIGTYELPIYDRAFPEDVAALAFAGDFDAAREALARSDERPDAADYLNTAGRISCTRGRAADVFHLLQLAEQEFPDHEEIARRTAIARRTVETEARRRRRRARFGS